MKYLKQAWYWLVFSSADPQKVSLTVKGILIVLLTNATVIFGLANIALPSDMLTQIIDNVVMLVQNTLMFISVAITLIGLIRKLFKTFAGTNQVLQ